MVCFTYETTRLVSSDRNNRYSSFDFVLCSTLSRKVSMQETSQFVPPEELIRPSPFDPGKTVHLEGKEPFDRVKFQVKLVHHGSEH